MEVLKGTLEMKKKRARIARKGTESYGGSIQAAKRIYKVNDGATTAVSTTTTSCNNVYLKHLGSNYQKF